MRDRDAVPVDMVRPAVAARTGTVRDAVSDDLMAVKVEIDPVVRGSPFAATEHFAVEAARGGKVVDRAGEMERGQVHRGDP